MEGTKSNPSPSEMHGALANQPINAGRERVALPQNVVAIQEHPADEMHSSFMNFPIPNWDLVFPPLPFAMVEDHNRASLPSILSGIELGDDDFEWEVIFGFDQEELDMELESLSAKLRVVFAHFRLMFSQAKEDWHAFLQHNSNTFAQECFELSNVTFERSTQLKYLDDYKFTVYSEISQLKEGYDEVYGQTNGQEKVDDVVHQTVIQAIREYLKARNDEILSYPVFRAIINAGDEQNEESLDMRFGYAA